MTAIALGVSWREGNLARWAPPHPAALRRFAASFATSPARGEVGAGGLGRNRALRWIGTLPLAGRVGVGGAARSAPAIHPDFLALHIPLRGSFIHMGHR